MDAESYQLWSVILQGITVLIAGVAAGLALSQVRKMVDAIHATKESNKTASLAALAQVEMQVYENLSRIDAHSTDIIELRGVASGDDRKSLDRLCSLVVLGVYPNDRARREFEDLVKNATVDHCDLIPDFIKSYPNISKLRVDWELDVKNDGGV